MRIDSEKCGRFIHEGLSDIYAYIYGYKDSPCYLRNDPDMEIKLMSAKFILEDEMVEAWLPIMPIPDIENQDEAADYLQDYVENNAGVHHELFEYLRDDVSRDAMIEFLRLEVFRNEVVDDEVALMVCGLQGNMKKVACSNLSDECGNLELSGFHTYWLRRLIDHLDDWEGILKYRQQDKVWSSSITSNNLNMLLTRPAYKLRAYGCFTTSEAWVQPHFERIMVGLKRLDLYHEDIAIYFSAHEKLDPHHTQELIDGLRYQTPQLTPQQVQEVLKGSHLCVAGGVAQYQRVLQHLRNAY